MYNNLFYRTCFDGIPSGSFIGMSFINFLLKMSQSSVISNNFFIQPFIGVFHVESFIRVLYRGSFIIFSIKLSQSNIISNDFFTGGSSRVLHRGSFIGGPSSGVLHHFFDKGESI